MCEEKHNRGSYIKKDFKMKVKVTQLCLTVCDPHGLVSPWNSLGQNTIVGSLSFLQGIFPIQVSHIAGRFFTSWATGKDQEYWSG